MMVCFKNMQNAKENSTQISTASAIALGTMSASRASHPCASRNMFHAVWNEDEITSWLFSSTSHNTLRDLIAEVKAKRQLQLRPSVYSFVLSQIFSWCKAFERRWDGGNHVYFIHLFVLFMHKVEGGWVNPPTSPPHFPQRQIQTIDKRSDLFTPRIANLWNSLPTRV